MRVGSSTFFLCELRFDSTADQRYTLARSFLFFGSIAFSAYRTDESVCWWHYELILLAFLFARPELVHGDQCRALLQRLILRFHWTGRVSFDTITSVPVFVRLFCHRQNNTLCHHIDRHASHALPKERPLQERPIHTELQQELHVTPEVLQPLQIRRVACVLE